MTRLCTALLLLVGALELPACELYDPPPALTLAEVDGGIRTLDAPLELIFSEAISPSSLSVGIWQVDQLNGERELPADAPALMPPCIATTCPAVAECEGAALCVDEEGLGATLSFGEPFASLAGQQLLLVIEAGLEDLEGNARGVASHLPFILSPDLTGAGDDPIDVSLNSGVLTLISNLSGGNAAINELYPNLYLRLLVDVIVDSADGRAWLLATVARLSDEVKAENPTSEVPTDRAPILDHEGWSVQIDGKVDPLGDGTFWLETTPRDVSVWVLGAIEVVLSGFQLRGTIAPGEGEGGRDRMYGSLITSAATVNLGAPNDLGPVEAVFTGDGLFTDEVQPELPRLCSEVPCAPLERQGGDCQLTTPWAIPSPCP